MVFMSLTRTQSQLCSNPTRGEWPTELEITFRIDSVPVQILRRAWPVFGTQPHYKFSGDLRVE